MKYAQQNRHLGRALLAVMIKYARETKNTNIENQLRTQLALVGVKMDEVLSTKFSAPTADRNRSACQLKNGDIALEFSNGREAYFTSMGAEPSTPKKLVLAKKLDLISSYSNLPLFAQQKYYDDALDKTRSNFF